jgi:hypothetical protein
MSTCVCVLSNSGERLMPTFRLGKVRRQWGIVTRHTVASLDIMKR